MTLHSFLLWLSICLEISDLRFVQFQRVPSPLPLLDRLRRSHVPIFELWRVLQSTQSKKFSRQANGIHWKLKVKTQCHHSQLNSTNFGFQIDMQSTWMKSCGLKEFHRSKQRLKQCMQRCNGKNNNRRWWCIQDRERTINYHQNSPEIFWSAHRSLLGIVNNYTIVFYSQDVSSSSEIFQLNLSIACVGNDEWN